MTKTCPSLTIRLTVVGLLVLGAGACRGTAAVPQAQTGSAGDAGQETVATISGTPVTRAELEADAPVRLFSLRTQAYQASEQLIHELIAERLMRQEAQARGMSVEKLEAEEVDAKAVPVTEAEVTAHYERIKARVGNRPKEQVLQDIEAAFKRRRVDERRAAYQAELFEKAGVKITLEPPRVSLPVEDDGRTLGPAGAPVTLIEFSDYQCPYCARAALTLVDVRARYGDKLRIVFRDMPLRSIHPNAAKAAEAAACAKDQGKFWEMNEHLFAHQGELDPEGLKRQAAEIDLDGARFAECLDSGRKAAGVSSDADLGADLGITGTPAFILNGRLLSGALSADRFAELIDAELARVESGGGRGEGTTSHR